MKSGKRVRFTVRSVALIVSVFCCAIFVNCGEKQKVYKVGVLSGLDFFSEITDGFRQKMTELGYVDGKNILYDIQKAPAPVGNQTILRKFVNDKVDLIFVFPTEATFEAKTATKGTGIPVVFGTALIEMPGIIETMRLPGGNITGVQYGGNDIAVKRLELLHEIFPQGKKIWIPYLKGYPTVQPNLEALLSASKHLNVSLIQAPFASVDELKADLKSRETSGKIEMDAILQIVEPLSVLPGAYEAIKTFGEKYKLPIAGAFVTKDDFGPVIGFRPDNKEMGILAAPLADKIFKGVQAGMIPVVTPEGILELNYRVIKKLGLTVSEGLMSRAVTIIH
jgi:putative tryptophan/tyrosine transport system substrate-binding protein